MTPYKNTSLFPFEKELQEEINNADIMEIEPGTVILKENEFIKVVPLVLEGSIRLRRSDPAGREIIFYHIEPGESCILSITSCLNEKESQAEGISVTRTRLIVIQADKIRQWMDKYPTWRRFVIRLYYNRISELLTLLDHVIFKSVDSRLIRYLKEKAVNNEIRITHQQLAGALGTAREVVSRLLKQMERDQAISLQRGRIIILKTL
ncbi:MAG: Crp/Fnr family transcriptional regulator [Bacteroidetes bacterium]|nr:MAG: Crp/Fnr family transcriptional regulator [Bacteroidota bacterium]